MRIDLSDAGLDVCRLASVGRMRGQGVNRDPARCELARRSSRRKLTLPPGRGRRTPSRGRLRRGRSSPCASPSQPASLERHPADALAVQHPGRPPPGLDGQRRVEPIDRGELGELGDGPPARRRARRRRHLRSTSWSASTWSGTTRSKSDRKVMHCATKDRPRAGPWPVLAKGPLLARPLSGAGGRLVDAVSSEV